MEGIIFGIMLLCLAIWIGLLTLRGQFWRTDQRLEVGETMLESLPTVCAVIPARNEADLLPISLRSLLRQDYHGSFNVFLVDDHSTDGTPDIALGVAYALNKSQQLQIVSAQPLPPGWTGKLWAIEQGIQTVETRLIASLQKPDVASLEKPDYYLLTDADIEHDVANLRRLVAKAEKDNLDLVSVMVRLRCKSLWEQLLIPAFVFFFQKIYPFRWVNDPNNPTAAAGGGCILIRREALNRIGGIKAVRHALIDDCALANAIKSGGLRTRHLQNLIMRYLKPLMRRSIATSLHSFSEMSTREKGINNSFPPFGFASRLNAGNPRTALDSPSHHLPISPSSTGRIWLGLSTLTRSLRPYPSLTTIWDMVARTAYTQLNYSPLLLILTLVGMTLIYIVPPLGLVLGALMGHWGVAFIGLLTWLLMSLAYLPTIRFYKCPVWLVFCLSAIAFLYTFMTLDSALRHWQGRGGAWKGRVYPG
jgi:hopene-associated glycosyltransferase HpnB